MNIKDLADDIMGAVHEGLHSNITVEKLKENIINILDFKEPINTDFKESMRSFANKREYINKSLLDAR